MKKAASFSCLRSCSAPASGTRRCLRKSQAAAIPGAAASGNSSPRHRRGGELRRRVARAVGPRAAFAARGPTASGTSKAAAASDQTDSRAKQRLERFENRLQRQEDPSPPSVCKAGKGFYAQISVQTKKRPAFRSDVRLYMKPSLGLDMSMPVQHKTACRNSAPSDSRGFRMRRECRP